MSDIFKLGPLAVKPGEKKQAFLPVHDTGAAIPATVIAGCRPGKTVLITAGIHSCEYVGVQASIELAAELDPERLCGRLIILHTVNRKGFETRQPTVHPEDGKNINRVFPGHREGTLSEKIAHFLEHEIYLHIDFYMDLHSGEIYEGLTPYVYYVGEANADVVQEARQAAMQTDVPYMVCSTARTGAYNYAGLLGIPSILLERGSAGRFSREDVEADKADIRNVLRYLGVIPETVLPTTPATELTDLVYQPPLQHGLWYPAVKPGERILNNQYLGCVKDYFGQVLDTYYATGDGVVLYMTETLWTDDFCELIAYGKLKDPE